MPSGQGWQRLQGTQLAGGVLLRDLADVSASAVYRAEAETGEPLLVRLWSAEHGNPETIVNRHREAAFLDHPGLLRCLDAGMHRIGDRDYAFAVYEHPEALLSDGQDAMPLREVQALGAELADSLTYLHARDLVYCALDPSNVARKNGRWVLADYSQLRLSGEGYASETKRLLVTLPATPPEAFEGRVTPAWDAWGLAHLLRICLLGPQRRTRGERTEAEAPPVIPEPFASMLSACTVMDPERRCTVSDIARELQSMVVSAPRHEETAEDVTVPPPLDVVFRPEAQEKPPRRTRKIVALAAAGLALVLLFVFLYGRRESDGVVAQQSPATERPLIPGPLDEPAGNPPETASTQNTRARATTEAEISNVVESWVETFRSGDVSEHVKLYAPKVERFFLSRNVSAEEVRRVKQQAINAAREIRQYRVENVRTDIQSPARAVVTFDKTFDFAAGKPRAGKVRGVLYLEKIDEQWRIVGERDMRVYWQRRS